MLRADGVARHPWNAERGLVRTLVSVADLRITDAITIPEKELRWRFLPSGGPGGQHANRAASRAELLFDVESSSAFDESTRRRVLARLGGRAAGGVVSVADDSTRSQWRNRQRARARLAAMLREALRAERPRKPTRPSREARRRRLVDKRRRSETKRLRKRPEID